MLDPYDINMENLPVSILTGTIIFLIENILMEHLLCAWFCSRTCGYSSEPNGEKFLISEGLHLGASGATWEPHYF